MAKASLQQSAQASLTRHGKSFAWAARFLPREQADAAARLYAVCRSIDDLADDNPADVAAEALGALRVALDARDRGHPLVERILELDASIGLDRKALSDLIDGVEQDLAEVRISDEADLLRYAYRVAGTVGLMMCDVFGVKDRWARRHAIDLGIAMQLTNIARDIAEDAQLGRRYLPASWVDLPPSTILTPTPDQASQVMSATERLLDLAEVYYASGRAGLDYLPGQARTGIAVAAAVYREIGVRLRARGCDYRRGRVVVPAWRKALVSVQTLTRLPSRRLISQSHDGALHSALKDLHGQEAVEVAT